VLKRKKQKNPDRPRERTADLPLLMAFKDDWPGFRDEKLDTRVALIHFMRKASWKTREHRDNPDSYWMEHKELERAFGRHGFKEANERLELIHLIKVGSDYTGNASEYQLDVKAVEIIEEVDKRKVRGTLIKYLDGTGKIVRRIRKALASKNAKEVTATFWNKEKLPQTVAVELKSLNSLSDKLKRLLEGNDNDLFPLNIEKPERIYKYARKVIREAHTEVAGRGVIAQRYNIATTGRLTAAGISLQGCPRPVRCAALTGLWDYDFENCHYSIIYQMAKRSGLECEHIANYMENKAAIRKQLAQEVIGGAGTDDIKQIKDALIAIIYGAPASSSDRGSIVKKIFKGDKEKGKRLIAHRLFREVHSDVKSTRRLILDSWPVSNRNTLINQCKLGISVKAKPNERMAHLIQGVEAYMLRTALRCYPEEIVLLIHDGFVSTKQLDRKQITQAIRDDSGYEMDLSEKQLKLDEKELF